MSFANLTLNIVSVYEFICLFLLEMLVLADSEGASGSWQDDFDRCVVHHIEDRQPCYILYRFVRILHQTEFFINID